MQIKHHQKAKHKMSESIEPDSIMLRKHRDENRINSSMFPKVVENWFHQKANTECAISPYIAIRDLNNQTPQDIKDCNPPKSSLVIGIKGTF